MKRTVDLTLKLDFKKKDISEERILLKIMKTKAPWRRFIHEYEETKRLSDDILLCGNRDERRKQKRRIFLESDICECCGGLLSRIVWRKKQYKLCERCDVVVWRK